MRATITVTTAQKFVPVAIVLLGWASSGCDQPKPKCTAAHGNFAATFTLVRGDGACSELTSGVLNVQSYNDSQPGSQVLDQNRPTLAIQAQDTTDVLWSGREVDPDARPFAFGAFDRPEPNTDGQCTVSELSDAVLLAPATEAVPEMMVDECTTVPEQPAMPELEVRYRWSNVRVVVTPAAIGTRLTADLEYTLDGCTAEYRVEAVWPLVECGVPVEEPDGPADEPVDDAGVPNPDCPEPEPPPPVLEPSDEVCATQGVIPDYALRCDPGLLMCVLDD